MKSNNFFFFSPYNLSKEFTLNSYRLMLKLGMIKQVSSGVYSWLPLGLKMLNKLKIFIKNELNFLNCQELILPSLQPIELWKKSGRYKTLSLKNTQIFDSNEKYVLPISSEELITETVKNFSCSYKDLSKIFYQITWKFRNEIRPRNGLLRSKEFLMKDAYSFDVNRKNSLINYEKMLKLYLLMLRKLRLKPIPILADNNNIGGHYSHEIHILSNNGDTQIFYEEKSAKYLEKSNFRLYDYENLYSMNKEKHFNTTNNKLNIIKKSSIEVGHIFYLGQKYSKTLNFFYYDEYKTKKFPEMCCYGIGVSRLLLLIIENSYNNDRLTLPKEILPFEIAIINSDEEDITSRNLSEHLYYTLSCQYDVLYHTNNHNFKQKISFVELVGIDIQIIICAKFLQFEKKK